MLQTTSLKRLSHLSISVRLVIVLLLLAGGQVLLPVPLARADTITVTNTSDSGAGSLRQAIVDAQPGDTIEFSVSGIISLTSGELAIDKDLTIDGPGAGSLSISGNNSSRVFNIGSGTVTIRGITIADGRAPNGSDGSDGGDGEAGGDGGGILNAGVLMLIDSTVRDNWAGQGGSGGAGDLDTYDGGNGGSGGSGGGIYTTGTLTLTNSTVRGNQAGHGGSGGDGSDNESEYGGTGGDGGTGGSGGGIYSSGTLTLIDSTVEDNQTGYGGQGGDGGDGDIFPGGGGDGSAGGDGGGIYSSGALALSNSTVSGNRADYGGNGGSGKDRHNGGAGGAGGGIYIASGTVIELTGSAISGNTTGDGGDGGDYYTPGNGGSGGGMHIATSAVVTLANSTISGNSTGDGGDGHEGGDGGDGGGISIASGAAITMVNATVSSNTTGVGDYEIGDGGDGGGVENRGTVSLKNTIIAGNSDSSGARDCYQSDGAFDSQGYNLVENTGNCSFGAAGDVVGQNPRLDPLGDNGGDTQTHALQPDSPAIDAASCTDVAGHPVTTDQRGVGRPQGAACDIGAYEHDLTLAKTVDDDTPNPGQLITFTITVNSGGFFSATNAIISDTLPLGLTFAGPVALEGTGGTVAQDSDDLPTLASGVTIVASGRITLTFPVTVETGLADGTPITNTVAFSSTQLSASQRGSVGLTVTYGRVYLPVVIRN